MTNFLIELKEEHCRNQNRYILFTVDTPLKEAMPYLKLANRLWIENEHGIKLYPTPDSLSDSDSGGELVTDPKEFVWLKLSAKVL